MLEINSPRNSRKRMGLIRFMNALFMLVILTVCHSRSMAGVNLKNGNFYISYTDMVLPQTKIGRTHNSKSSTTGTFGAGWGTDFDTRLAVGADKRIVIHEAGSGARTIFNPIGNENGTAKTDVSIAEAVDALISTMTINGEFADAKEARTFKARLESDEEIRSAILQFRNSDRQSVDANSAWVSYDRGYQVLKRVDNNYVRYYADGSRDTFDLDGKLVRLENPKDQSFIRVEYDANNRLDRIICSDDNVIDFFYGARTDRLVKRIQWGQSFCEYEYDGIDLIMSKDAVGNVFRFLYDQQHQMTKITYQDESTLQIKYEDRTEFVQQITERDGSVIKYRYESDPDDPESHYWTTIEKTAIGGRPVVDRFEYWIDQIPSTGQRYTRKISSTVNGVEKVTEYNEKSKPIVIRVGDEKTEFQYDDEGRLTEERSSDGEFVQLEYHPVVGKVSKFTDNIGSTTFDYDYKGNLTVIDKGETIELRLKYNSANQITESQVGDRTLLIGYDEKDYGRPSTIELKGKGKVEVVYDQYGARIWEAEGDKPKNVATRHEGIRRTSGSHLSGGYRSRPVSH